MRQRTIGYMGAIALAMATTVVAQEQTPIVPERETMPARSTTEDRRIEGEVLEVSARTLAVRTDDGRRMTFTVDRDLTTGAEPITVGSRVRVDYHGEEQLMVSTVGRIPVGGAEVASIETTPQPAPPAVERRDELPGTSSPLPMMLAAGLALLGSGIGLSAWRRS
jgi:hypothetical protein